MRLTDDLNRILWSNSAFRRGGTEKISGKMDAGEFWHQSALITVERRTRVLLKDKGFFDFWASSSQVWMLVKCSIVDCSLLVVAVCRFTYWSLGIPLQLAVLMFQPPENCSKQLNHMDSAFMIREQRLLIHPRFRMRVLSMKGTSCSGLSSSSHMVIAPQPYSSCRIHDFSGMCNQGWSITLHLPWWEQ